MSFSEAPLLFVGNGQYANRGCEAIAKSSVRLIREYFPQTPIINGNELGEYDQVDETEPNVIHKQCSCLGGVRRMQLSDAIYKRTRLLVDISHAGKMVRQWAPQSRAVLSMGGDLYGLSHGRRVLLQYIFLGEAAVKLKKPFIIWGATIGKIDAEPILKRTAIEHFKRCSLILVRDQTSFDYLSNNGVNDNLKLVADPAFLLEPHKPRFDLPYQNELSEMIGFNLASAYGAQGNLGTYRDMIKLGADCVETIMQKTGRKVILIPHIVSYPETTWGNDTLFLSLIKECLLERDIQIDLVPSSLRCWELKWVMSRLKAYVGSRFHSTIGAMGSGTPTVSISFSEKAPALNELLLNHSKFVIHCKDLTVDRLSNVLSELLSEEDSTRKSLQLRLPEIKALAHKAGQYLQETLGQ